ncbi:TonB-dependent receptor domain-containing protein [Hephaestia mangrovi]|uniref:TonB-dependent receptor domain-containing protein n=1 Tax=Hephaestia mangrovi TaxID=2873268 RepID=UPI001CA75129|nr:TonB-dependent receptor [Hephaestia mangrovi]MBY8826527.1 TonB-dependent receptor [Hephaestia mangrovi]
MTTYSLTRSFLTGTCATIALLAGHARAQTSMPAAENPPPEAQESAAPQPAQEIIVTGSRIARRDYVADSPIISISQDTVQNSGRPTIEDALNQMPQFSGAFGSANGGSTSTGLNGGQAYASLRGLGPKRTLILLDGRRLQPSNPDGSIDLNIIPEALIANVETITGGASTAYGSDATAGVVNFKLRNDFHGIEINAQTGVSDYGDGDTYRITTTLGDSFADERGHAVLSFDYTKRNRALQSRRDYFVFRKTKPGLSTIPQGSTVFGANRPTVDAVNNVFENQYGAAPFTGDASGAYIGQIGFNTDQSLFSTIGVPIENLRDPETDSAYIVNSGTNSQQLNFGYNGSSVQSDLNRYNVFGKVDYKVTDDIKAFAQVTYTNYDSLGIANPTLASNVYGLSVPVTNPYISSDFASILASRPDPDADFTFYKAFNILGPRYQSYRYNVYQLTLGLSGTFGIKDWSWDVYGSTSKAKFENEQRGGASASALRNLLYSPTGGTELCDGGFNPFGNVTPSEDCINYIRRSTLNRNELKQRTVEANMQGGLFELPGGQVRFALGADYRYNFYSFRPDEQLSQPDGTSDILGYSVLRPANGSVSTKEIYGELLVPVLKDVPGIEELNLDLGYRYSDYNSVGGVHTYKADLDWQIFQPLRLRGGYNRAIRAPSVGELYAPVSTGSVSIGTPSATSTNGDPCDVRTSFRQGSDAAQVRALCLAQGVPADIIDSYQLGTAQVFALTGGNPDLKEETADTYSVGGVLQSPFSAPAFSNMSLSIDYYIIKIKDAIGPLSIAQAFQFCFNSGGNNPNFDPSNYYCSLITRNSASGVPVNPLQPLLNLGRFEVKGIDFQFDWKVPVGTGSIALNAAASYLQSFKIQALPGAPTYDYAGSIGASVESASGIAHPRWKSITSLTYSNGPISLGLRWRFIDSMINAARVVSPSSTTRGVNSYNVFDLNVRANVTDDAEFRFGVTNLFNHHPPQYGDTEGTFDAETYDVLGRYFFVGLTKRF